MGTPSHRARDTARAHPVSDRCKYSGRAPAGHSLPPSLACPLPGQLVPSFILSKTRNYNCYFVSSNLQSELPRP